ncbi:MAG: type II secretion system protein GspJ [Nanoarchaeota archaeon]|nr:type II secretion system protein GspJ [Nanoarchaeota archaeon]
MTIVGHKCNEDGDTHHFNLESRTVELPKINLVRRIWRWFNPGYIPDGSVEIIEYVCEGCNKERIERLTLKKDYYEPLETIRVSDPSLWDGKKD